MTDVTEAGPSEKIPSGDPNPGSASASPVG